jgi:hypothetical protein
MKIFRKIINAWLACASLAGFLVGWICLARSGETQPTEAATTSSSTVQMPALQPLPTLTGVQDQTTSSVKNFTLNTQVQQSQSAFAQTNPSSFVPQMRTGGS